MKGYYTNKFTFWMNNLDDFIEVDDVVEEKEFDLYYKLHIFHNYQ